MKKSNNFALSVVIPTYNAASWLPKTIPKVEEALKNAGITSSEFVIVDDGSTDNSGQVAKDLKTEYPLSVVRQPNSGRFLARKLGTEKAKYDFILFIDTRIYIKPDALKFIVGEISKNPSRRVWTSHVYMDKEANIYARFWDAIATLAWHRYFSNPRDYSYGIKEFDYFPKGTTCFIVPKQSIVDANKWFMTKTKDLKTSNDDTLLIRRICETENINVNPKFACVYHARSSLKQYVKHVFHRGKVFVDGFLRRDGNRFFWPLVAFLLLSVAVPVFLILQPQYILSAVLILVALWILELLVCLAFKLPMGDTKSLVLLTPIFAVFYGLGIWSAFIKIYVTRTATNMEKQT